MSEVVASLNDIPLLNGSYVPIISSYVLLYLKYINYGMIISFSNENGFS